MKNKIIKLLEMQKELDHAFMTENNTSYDGISDFQYFSACIDEVGEFIHTRKPDWCWWSKKQKEAKVDYKHSLEEMVDILHFVLGFNIKHNIFENLELNVDLIINELKVELNDISDEKAMLIIKSFIDFNSNDKYTKITEYFVIASFYGYSFEELYNAYFEKNKENYERIAKGY